MKNFFVLLVIVMGVASLQVYIDVTFLGFDSQRLNTIGIGYLDIFVHDTIKVVWGLVLFKLIDWLYSDWEFPQWRKKISSSSSSRQH